MFKGVLTYELISICAVRRENLNQMIKDKKNEKIKCWEAFKCDEKDCPAYKKPDLRCWLLSGTHCRKEIQGKFIDKIEMCLDCRVFKKNMDLPAIRKSCLLINKQMKEFTRMVRDRDSELESMGMELAIGLSEVFEALKKISAGDPTVRIPETSEIELISKLKEVINLTAKDIREIVDQSHEFAMVLAEYFDVLHRVAKGELSARVTGESQIELLLALKDVLNNTIAGIDKKNTEHKLYQKRLEHASEEWRTTFDSMPYGVFLIDMDFNILRANKYASLTFEVPFENIKGKPYSEMVHYSQFKEQMSVQNNSYLKDIEFYDEKLNKYFKQYVAPIPDHEGITKAFVVSLVDITKTKEDEHKLVESKDAFFNMLKELDVSYKGLKDLHESLIHSFVNAIDAKSPWTKGHSERVTSYSVAIAMELGFPERDIEILRIAALLHDIGKIGTYDQILDKQGKLTDEEFALIRMHPVRGEEILKPISQFTNLLPIIRHHHERLDGKGYPDRLKYDEIPFLAKIISIADSYDSMTSDRPYRSAPPREYAISELKKCSGTQFEPQAVQAFLTVLGRLE
ncbi:MAG: HD domain-containing protein [Nitrospira sp.]|nr:HD domain-containing protein [Nitrospira sp.]